MTDNEDYPVIFCDEVKNPGMPVPQWTFWCSFCQRRHFHSAGEGYRVAHCHNTNAPSQGYILKIRKPGSDEVCLMCEGLGRYPSGKICETCLGKGTIPKEWNE